MTTTKHFYSGRNTLLISGQKDDNKEVERGDLMKLTTMLNTFRNATSEKLRIHDLNYQLPKKEEKEYWYKECIAHPTNSHCKIYCD